jgi:hypothetical protein
MALDFSTAPQEQGGELIPDNTLAWATVNVRPKAIDMGRITHQGRDTPANRYLDLEIELTSGPSTGRKVFHKLGVAGSEKWVNMSMAAIRHILEVGRKAGAANPQGYMLGVNLPDGDERMWMELDGLKCAVKVGIEKGKDGYKDKNEVKAFLSPHEGSSTNKDFAALVAGATVAAGGRAEKPTGGNAWATPAATPAVAGAAAQPQPSAANPATRPNWLDKPPATVASAGNPKPPKLDDDTPW